MALTPEDVSNKRFTTVRLREGYDMTEVDQFLDEVEAELERRTSEADELRAKLHAAQTGEAAPEPKGDAAEPRPVAAVETLQVTTTAEASAAAARLLELAGNNADALVSEARQQAEQIVGDAESSARRLEEESTARAESLEADARQRADTLEAETAERRTGLLSELDREKSGLDAEIERLRTFEREYRAELRSYFEQQLAALDGRGGAGSLGGAPHEQPSGGHSDHTDADEQGEAPSQLQTVVNEGHHQ